MKKYNIFQYMFITSKYSLRLKMIFLKNDIFIEYDFWKRNSKQANLSLFEMYVVWKYIYADSTLRYRSAWTFAQMHAAKDSLIAGWKCAIMKAAKR